MVPSAKHKKIDSEGRLFKEEWIEKYFFVEHNNNPLCLICQETIAVFKEHNIKRHYDSKHKKYSEITGQFRKDKIVKFKSNLRSQSSTFIITKS